MIPKYPIRGRSETGDVVIDITEIVAPDDAFTEGSGVLQIASSTGDVTGPASSTDNAIARFNGTTGKTIQNSSGFITDGGVIYGVNLAPGLTTTADAVVDAQLTVTSTGIQRFTASAASNNVLLPVVTTLPQVGYGFLFVNDTAGSITVASSGGNAVATITTGNRALITCVALTGTTAASWTVTPISATSIPFTAASASGAASLAFAEDTDNGSHAVTVKAPAAVTANVDVTLPDAAGTVALTSQLPPFTAASSSSSASLAFAEDTDNGAHAVTLKAPAAVTADVDVVLPDAAGTVALIAQTITNGVTTSAPSEDAVFDALAVRPVQMVTVPGIQTNVGTKQNLLSAVPVSKQRIVTRVVVRNASATLAGFSGEDGMYFGFNAGATESNNLFLSPSVVETVTTSAHLIQSAGASYDGVAAFTSLVGVAGEVFGISMGFTGVTATVTVDVFYYDVDA